MSAADALNAVAGQAESLRKSRNNRGRATNGGKDEHTVEGVYRGAVDSMGSEFPCVYGLAVLCSAAQCSAVQ